jgi:hypothetical protein
MIILVILLDILAGASTLWLLMSMQFAGESSRGRGMQWPDLLLLLGLWLLPVCLAIASYCISLGRTHWAFSVNCWLVIAFVSLMSLLLVSLLVNAR